MKVEIKVGDQVYYGTGEWTVLEVDDCYELVLRDNFTSRVVRGISVYKVAKA